MTSGNIRVILALFGGIGLIWGCSKENNIDASQTNSYSQAITCEGPAVDNAMCEAAAEAPAGAVCVYGACRQPCTTDAECEAEVPGAICLPGPDGGVSGCRLPQEESCTSGGIECLGDTVCGWDGSCRVPCADTQCWLEGLSCVDGVCVGTATGAGGTAGSAGSGGAAGSAGSPGAAGAAGSVGSAGTAGSGSAGMAGSAGSAGVAGSAGSAGCVPVTCASVGADCGMMDDGCGELLDCGTCTAPETCGGSGIPNQCGNT